VMHDATHMYCPIVVKEKCVAVLELQKESITHQDKHVFVPIVSQLAHEVQVLVKKHVFSPVPAIKPKTCLHELKVFETNHGGFTCDECLTRMPIKSKLHGCRTCNIDYCLACVGKMKTVPSVVPSVPQAKFVSDVTLADGCLVRPGEVLHKVWRVRNTGNEDWPSGVRLMHVGGDLLGAISGQEVGMVKAGALVNLNLALTMPLAPGRYTSYWRLSTPSPTNARFGHRFWVTVQVVEALPKVPEVSEEEGMSVSQIVEFGFTDVEKIITLLRQEGGDTGKTIDRLLQEE